MSAQLLCVHPNLGALSETAANWTWMYQYQDSERDHTATFYSALKGAIESIRAKTVVNRTHNQSQYVSMFYSWDLRVIQWEQLLRSL